MRIFSRVWVSGRIASLLICLFQLICTPLSSLGEIRFEDSSQRAGIIKNGPTAASAWGDFNSDGWPDLWVSNHLGRRPSLYLNQRDSTFIDIADKVLANDASADFHGAAWADFDNDGDQDLIVLTGAGGGRGIGPNYLFVNQEGKLTNKAKDLGLDYPLGQGRTPLWIDANRDGMLDVLLMNRRRADAPSAIFLQTPVGFVEQSKQLRFRHERRSRTENILGRIKRLMRFQFPSNPGLISVSAAFAQLADLSGSSQLELVAYMPYSRLFSVNATGFNEITTDFEFPVMSSIRDAAIEDFNGDAQLDWFLARSGRPLDVTQINSTRIQGYLGKWQNRPTSVLFRTEGDVTLGIYPLWPGPSALVKEITPQLFIGSRTLELKDRTITILSQDPAVREPAPAVTEHSDSISIEFHPELKDWTLKSSVHRFTIVIMSTKPIDSIQTQGFKPSKGDLPDVLLIRENDKFVPQRLEITEDSTACISVVAGDFDNDGDNDLYLVCTGPTENFPNILYENDGNGNFVQIPRAGGAEGSARGRGNQAITADFDRDGFLDLFVANGEGNSPFADEGPHQLFRNLGNDNHWLQIDLEGVVSNHDGIGAKVILDTKGKVQVRHQDGGMHSYSQDYARIHFGLGPYENVDRLTIFWPSGAVQHLRDIRANQILLVKEPT